MILKRIIYTLLFIFCAFIELNAQKFPQYDCQPMALSPDVSGGFCVMRPHHFHLGLDFRTQRKEGWNIYAVEQGWVKRIKISHYGYGKSIQIQHPDGYVSHYGHLSKYAALIDAYIKKLQYELKCYEFDFFLPAGAISVAKGQVIAYSGNSGGSQGPHLHFEIRDSTNTYVYNPLLFGIKISDTKAPVLKGLRFYSKGKEPVTHEVKINKYGNYYMSGFSTFNAFCFWELSYNALDPQNGSGFNNSVYKAQLFVDDSLAFEFKMDSLKIDDQRSSDFHMDYDNWVRTGFYYEKLWLNDETHLPIYTNGLKGLWQSLSNGVHTVKVKLADFNKNTTSFSFKLNFDATECISIEGPEPDPNFFVEHNKDKVIRSDDNKQDPSIILKIPAFTFFRDYVQLYPKVDVTLNTFGELNFTLGDKYTPLHNAYTVEIITNHKKVPIDKLCVVYYGKEGKIKYYSPITYNESKLTVELKDLGSFSVWADTVRPVIKKMNIRDSMYVMFNDTIKTYATDELSDICKYNAYIDRVWHLTEYEYKLELLATALPESLSVGPHSFEIEVMDDRNNKAYRKMTIIITKNKADLLLNKKKK